MNKTTIQPGTYSVTQIAELTGYSGQYIRDLIRDGVLPGVNIGRQFVIQLTKPVDLKCKIVQ